MTGESDHIVAEVAARIFADLADPQTINRAKDERWKETLWHALDAGLPLAWVPEQFGGSGASLADGFAILGVAGRFALAVPLAETMIAGWLLTRAGLLSPAGPMTVAPVRPHDRIEVRPGRHAERLRLRSAICYEVRGTSSCSPRTDGAVIALVETKNCRLMKAKIWQATDRMS